MATQQGLRQWHAAQPDSATMMAWCLEAARAGFEGPERARLAFWRWLAPQMNHRGWEQPMDPRRRAFLDEIRQHFGTPYAFGGKGPPAWDCSGILTYAAVQVGLQLGDPYFTSAEGLKHYADAIPMAEALPGDLYLFAETYGSTGPDYATHCGAATGDGTHMLDDHGDPWPGCGQTDISSPYWQAHLMGCWRPNDYRDQEEDPLKIAELESQLGYLQHDVAAALQQALDSARQAHTVRERREALDALQAAIATLQRGG